MKITMELVAEFEQYLQDSGMSFSDAANVGRRLDEFCASKGTEL